jgi:hypothetical protein
MFCFGVRITWTANLQWRHPKISEIWSWTEDYFLLWYGDETGGNGILTFSHLEMSVGSTRFSYDPSTVEDKGKSLPSKVGLWLFIAATLSYKITTEFISQFIQASFRKKLKKAQQKCCCAINAVSLHRGGRRFHSRQVILTETFCVFLVSPPNTGTLYLCGS